MHSQATVDSTMNFVDPVFLGIQAALALAVLGAVIRVVYLLTLAIEKRRLTRKEWFELFALLISLIALALVVGYAFFSIWGVTSWSTSWGTGQQRCTLGEVPPNTGWPLNGGIPTGDAFGVVQAAAGWKPMRNSNLVARADNGVGRASRWHPYGVLHWK